RPEWIGTEVGRRGARRRHDLGRTLARRPGVEEVGHLPRVPRMRFLLDTCTISAHVRRLAGIQARFLQYPGRLYVPSVALAELYVLAYRLDADCAKICYSVLR